jgi:hypothetical protein
MCNRSQRIRATATGKVRHTRTVPMRCARGTASNTNPSGLGTRSRKMEARGDPQRPRGVGQGEEADQGCRRTRFWVRAGVGGVLGVYVADLERAEIAAALQLAW